MGHNDPDYLLLLSPSRISLRLSSFGFFSHAPLAGYTLAQAIQYLPQGEVRVEEFDA